MRTFRNLLGALAILLTVVPSFAQQAPPTTTKTLSSTTCPGSGCLVVGVAGVGGVGVQLVGSFTATLTFYGTTDGTNYNTVICTPYNSTTGVTSATAAGSWGCPIGGLSYFKVQVTSGSITGSVVVTTRIAPTLARSGSGGGGGGGSINGSIGQYEIALGSGIDTITGIAPGTAGYVLTSNGAGANPTYQAPSGSFTGSLAAEQVAFGSGANAIAGSDNFNWDDVALTLNATAATSQARLYWDTYPMYFAQQVGTKTPGYIGYVFSTTAGDASGFFPMRSRGTAASPTEVQSGDTMGVVEPSGWDGSDFAVGSSFRLIATENYGASNHGTKGQLRLTSNGGSIQDTVYDFGQTTFAIPATSVTMPSSATLGAASGATGTLLFKGTTSGTVTLSTADAAGTWTMKLPTTDGNSGEFLQTDGSGNTTWAAGGGGLTIGSTSITGGTSTRILYDNAGVVGEYTLTGTGTTVVMQTDPNLLNTATLTRTAIGTTSTDGIILTNTTAAAAGAQQYSPRLRLTGQGWKTDATAASQTVDWIVENQITQGTATPATSLVFSYQRNAGGFSSPLKVTVDSSGVASLVITSGAGGTRTVTISSGIFAVDGAISSTSYVSFGGGWGSISSSGSGTPTIVASLNGNIVLQAGTTHTAEVRNGTSAQTFRVYNTWTDASNGEWWTSGFASNVYRMGTTKNGTGTARVASWDYGGTTTSAISVPATSGQLTLGGGLDHGANYDQFTEMTAPAAGAANTARLYAEDNGAGKTRLCVLFNSGAAQCFATEP